MVLVEMNPFYSEAAVRYDEITKRQADVTHDYRKTKLVETDDHTTFVEDILPSLSGDDGESMAFVVANILSSEECDELIKTAEEYGIVPPDEGAGTTRTAKRTRNYINERLSEKIDSRVRTIFESKFQQQQKQPDNTGIEIDEEKKDEEDLDNDINNETKGKNDKDDDYMGPYYGIHKNWRILRYDQDSGDSFPAHQDQMDSLQKLNEKTGTKDFIVSSHTLLINLSEDGLEGGCTRFYPRGKVGGAKKTSSTSTSAASATAVIDQHYNYTVDVVLPRGWGVIFKQRGLLHSGQPLNETSPVPKFVAQAGVLRLLPKGTTLKPSVFRIGPGLYRPY